MNPLDDLRHHIEPGCITLINANSSTGGQTHSLCNGEKLLL